MRCRTVHLRAIELEFLDRLLPDVPKRQADAFLFRTAVNQSDRTRDTSPGLGSEGADEKK
jgi:hypothetical protein